MAIEIKFNGKLYGNWQSVEIQESVDDLCASVRLAVMSLEQGAGVLPLTENTVIEVLVNGQLASTVRVDQLRRKVSPTSHSINIDGRSLGRELVDCQYSATMNNLKLEEILKRLCGTFKVPLKVNAKTELVPDFSMQCESPANVLINAARSSNLLLYPSKDGGLILAEPTKDAPVATLVYGDHIIEYDIVDEYKLRFSEYTIKGFDHAETKALKGSVKDDAFKYFRPFQVIADKHGKNTGGCERRAHLEYNRRKARAHRIDLVVQGWQHAKGLWAINTQVRIVIPQESIDSVLLIGERSFSFDDSGGSITRLQVMSRDAFVGETTKDSKKSAAASKKNSKKSKNKQVKQNQNSGKDIFDVWGQQ